MYSPQEIQERLEQILLTVQKTGRYVGGEYNQVIKEWDAVSTHVALAFPDIYDIGLPNLGITILYQSLNRRPDVWAERTYCPWTDMEALMRQGDIPLYSLESKHPLAAFDILGITLPYETLFTNTLNMLDLARIPIRSTDRDASHPLVIAGGHATFNPEPMAPFIDAFAIGEGEDIIHEIVDAHSQWKAARQSRQELLHTLARIPGYTCQPSIRLATTLMAQSPESIAWPAIYLPASTNASCRNSPRHRPTLSYPPLRSSTTGSRSRSCAAAPGGADSATPE